MKRKTHWIVAWTCLGIVGPLVADAVAQLQDEQEDPNAAAFAQLGGSDPIGIVRGSEHLAQAGKTDPAVVTNLAAMMWDERFSGTSRYWALRTLADIGPNAKAVMPDLVKAMNHPDAYFRLRGSLAILRAGGPTEEPIATLQTLARGRDGFVAMGAFGAFAEAGPAAAEAAPFLIEVIGEKDNDHREYAVKAVGAVGPSAKKAIPLLIGLLKDEDEDMRLAAAASLSQIGSDDPDALQALVGVIGQEGYEGHVAAEGLIRGGKAVVPFLIQTLKGDNAIARARAAHALRFIGRAAEPAAGALVEFALKSSGDESGAIDALGSLGAAGVPYLVGLLENPKVEAKWKVAETLGEIGPDAKPAVPALLKVMKDPEAEDLARSAAGKALSEIGAGAAEAVPELIGLLSDTTLNVADEAIVALGAIGPAAKDAVQPLMAVIKTDNRFGNYGDKAVMAATSLGQIGKAAEPAVPLLVAMLSSGYPAGTAAEALGRLGPAAKAALPRLRELYPIADYQPRVQAALAVSLIDLKSTDGVEALIRWLSTPEDQYPEYEKQAAAEALGLIGPRAEAALPELRRLVDDKTELSAKAALAIYRINPGDPAPLDSLIRTLGSGDTFGPAAACHALQEIGPAAKAALPELIRIAQNLSRYYERDQARRAIRAIDPAAEP